MVHWLKAKQHSLDLGSALSAVDRSPCRASCSTILLLPFALVVGYRTLFFVYHYKLNPGQLILRKLNSIPWPTFYLHFKEIEFRFKHRLRKLYPKLLRLLCRQLLYARFQR